MDLVSNMCTFMASRTPTIMYAAREYTLISARLSP